MLTVQYSSMLKVRTEASCLQVRGRPLGGTAVPAIVDQYANSKLDDLPVYTKRYIDVEGLRAGTGYQVL